MVERTQIDHKSKFPATSLCVFMGRVWPCWTKPYPNPALRAQYSVPGFSRWAMKQGLGPSHLCKIFTPFVLNLSGWQGLLSVYRHRSSHLITEPDSFPLFSLYLIYFACVQLNLLGQSSIYS